jgi:WD40 repeat protein
MQGSVITKRLQLDVTITDLESGVLLGSQTFQGYSSNCPETLVSSPTGFDPVTGKQTMFGEFPQDDFAKWLQSVMAWAALLDVAVILTGHTDDVWQVLYSPNGQNILTVSWGQDYTVRIWDAQTGQQQRQMENLGWVSSAAYSPDGSLVITGNSDGEVTVWDASTGETVRVIQIASNDQWSGQANAVAFSPDGTQIAAGGTNNRVEVWNLGTGDKQLDLQGHSDNITSVAFSPDGKSILTASDDATVRIWDAITGEERLQFTGITDAVAEAHYSPDGQHVLTYEWQQGTTRVWDATTGRLLFQIEEGNPFFSPRWVGYTPDGQSILTLERNPDQLLTLWDAQTGERLEQLRTLTGIPDPFLLSISPDGRYLAVAVAERVVIWPMR